MTAIKHALQRDIFTPNDERLLSIVNVCKAGKKKKNCFLCATGGYLVSQGSCLAFFYSLGVISSLFKIFSDFPGGPVVKNLPSSAGDMHSIPGQGTKIPRATGQLSLHSTTREACVLQRKILHPTKKNL